MRFALIASIVTGFALVIGLAVATFVVSISNHRLLERNHAKANANHALICKYLTTSDFDRAYNKC